LTRRPEGFGPPGPFKERKVLVISRKKAEGVQVGESKIWILGISKSKVKIGIEANGELRIWRLDSKEQNENELAKRT